MSKLKIAYFSMWGFNKGWWPRWDIVLSYLNKPKFLYDHRSPEDIAKKLEEIIKNPRKRIFCADF